MHRNRYRNHMRSTAFSDCLALTKLKMPMDGSRFVHPSKMFLFKSGSVRLGLPEKGVVGHIGYPYREILVHSILHHISHLSSTGYMHCFSSYTFYSYFRHHIITLKILLQTIAQLKLKIRINHCKSTLYFFYTSSVSVQDP
jgi:hypothetical protein